MDVDHATTLLSEDPAVYMSFFDWMRNSSKEKRLQTYDEYWRRLCQYFTIFAQRSVNQAVHGQMRRFLDGVFPTERKISRRAKKKSTLDVDDFSVLLRHHWIYSTFFRHGNMMVQQAVVKLWSSITGTRPGVMLPQNEFAGSAVTGTPRQRKRKFPIQSDLPQLVSLNDLPNTVCL